jgi:RNA polymerase primary sigma factor
VVAAPRTLDEGIDVPDADFGVIVAGSSVLRQKIQRAGRVLRRAPGKQRACVLVLYVEATIDDPRGSGDASFARAMDELGRAHWFSWPVESDGISAFVPKQHARA